MDPRYPAAFTTSRDRIDDQISGDPHVIAPCIDARVRTRGDCPRVDTRVFVTAGNRNFLSLRRSTSAALPPLALDVSGR